MARSLLCRPAPATPSGAIEKEISMRPQSSARMAMAPAAILVALGACGEFPAQDPGGAQSDPAVSSGDPTAGVQAIPSALCANPPPTPDPCTRILWPNGVIYYELTSTLSAADVMAITTATNQWSSVTSSRIKFQADSSRADRVRIVPGCSSQLGMNGTMSSIGAGCVGHELGHLIGLSHHHQRNDRDRYVKVDPTLLTCPSYNDNVVTCAARSPYSDFGTFDYRSTMLYKPTLKLCSVATAGEPCCMTATSAGCEFIKKADGTSIPVDATGPYAAPTSKDGSDVLEMYGYQLGWTKFFSLGKDVGSTKPLSPDIAPGVQISGSPAVTTQGGSGKLDSFFVGTDGHLYHRFYNASNSTNWSSYFDLGLPPWDPNPSAASWGAGSVFVFAADRSNLWMRQFASGAWQTWTPLTTPSPGICSAPTAVSWASGRLDLFVRGCDGEIWTMGSNNLNWGSWSRAVAAKPSGVTFVNRVAATSTGGGKIDLFMNSTNGHLWQTQRTTSGWTTQWNDSACCADSASSPAVTHSGSGQLDLVVKGNDGRLWWRRFSGGTWAAFRAIGGILNSDPAEVSNSPNHVDVLTVGSDGGPWHRWLN
jgi:hypothetical protein